MASMPWRKARGAVKDRLGECWIICNDGAEAAWYV